MVYPADKASAGLFTATGAHCGKRRDAAKAARRRQGMREKSRSGMETGEEYLDRKLGLHYSADSREMYLIFLQLFADGKEERMRKLELAYAAGDWSAYRIQVHALKSASLSIGGRRMSELAAQLERAAGNQETGFIRKNHRAVLQLYEETVREAVKEITGNGA